MDYQQFFMALTGFLVAVFFLILFLMLRTEQAERSEA